MMYCIQCQAAVEPKVFLAMGYQEWRCPKCDSVLDCEHFDYDDYDFKNDSNME